MKTSGRNKGFDAVKMMRVIRDEMDRKIADMTFADEKAYIKKLVTKSSQGSSRKRQVTSR